MIDKDKIKVQKMGKDGSKTISVTIRITPAISKQLKDQGISPTGLFNEALREIGLLKAEK